MAIGRQLDHNDVRKIISLVTGGTNSNNVCKEHTIEALRALFPDETQHNHYKLKSFLEEAGRAFIDEVDPIPADKRQSLFAFNVLNEYAPLIHDPLKGSLYLELRKCNDVKKHDFYKTICKEVLRQDRTSSGPDRDLSKQCVALLRAFNSLQYSTLLAHAFYGEQAALISVSNTSKVSFGPSPLPGLLSNGRTEAQLTSLVECLTKDSKIFDNLRRLLSASPSLLQLCEEEEMDAKFLMFLIENNIDIRKPNVATDGTLVVLSDEDIAKGKLEPCDRLAQVRTVLALFPKGPHDPTRKNAIDFLTENKDALFAMNTEMAELFAQHGRAIAALGTFTLTKVVSKFSKATTADDNTVITALFNGMMEARKAYDVIDSISFNTLSQNQRKALSKAFVSRDVSDHDKFSFYCLIVQRNFQAEQLNAIAALHSIISDRQAFANALSTLPDTNPLFNPRIVELLQLLRKKGVVITYNYAVYLSGLLYLPEFKSVIEAFPDDRVQSIFKPENKRAEARDWIDAFMVQAVGMSDPKFASKVFQLVFHLWSFAEAHKTIGLDREKLLGKDFNLKLVGFVRTYKLASSTEPEKFFALQADVVKCIAMIVPPTSSRGGLLGGLFGGSAPAASSAPRIEDVSVRDILGLLNLQWNQNQGRFLPAFNTQAERGAYIEFIEEGEARMALTGQDSFLALTDVPAAPVAVTEVKDDVQPGGQKMLTW